MKTIIFAKRNLKELIRDPLSLIFSFGLPLFLLVIFQQFKIPSEVYNINNFAPSIIIFSYSFITLFTASLVSKDRSTSFLTRLFSSPLSIENYILGYSLAIVPFAVLQSILFILVSIVLDLNFNINCVFTIILLIPIAFLFVGLGILIGCLFNDKQTPGFSSIIIQLMAFTSGMWFDVSMMSKVFASICNALPFKYSVDIARYSINGVFDKLGIPFIIIIIYIVVIYVITFCIFKKQMQK